MSGMGLSGSGGPFLSLSAEEGAEKCEERGACFTALSLTMHDRSFAKQSCYTERAGAEADVACAIRTSLGRANSVALSKTRASHARSAKSR